MPAGRRSAEDAGVVAGEADELRRGLVERAAAACSALAHRRVERDAGAARGGPAARSPRRVRSGQRRGLGPSAVAPGRRPRRDRARGRRSTAGTWAGIVVSALGSTSMRPAVTTKSGRRRREVLGGDDQARGRRHARRGARPGGSCRRGRRGPWRSACTPQPRRQAGRPRRRAGRLARGRASGRCGARGSRAAARARPGAPARPSRVHAGRRPSRRAASTPSSSRRAEHVVEVEPPGQRAAAERRRVEARALLVGEGDHGDGRAARAATSNAAATPSGPSKRAAAGARSPGASRRPTTGPRPAGGAHRLPAGSRSTRRPSPAACSANQARRARPPPSTPAA